jgi:protein involved in polysaccharide export with SLBB domain
MQKLFSASSGLRCALAALGFLLGAAALAQTATSAGSVGMGGASGPSSSATATVPVAAPNAAPSLRAAPRADAKAQVAADAKMANPGDFKEQVGVAQVLVDPKAEETEFQRFVQNSTGQALRLYGYELFNKPGSFAPVQAAPVPAGYILGPGDELVVQINGLAELSENLVIDRDGRVLIPKVGPLSLAGVALNNAEKVLAAHIGKVYRNFTVSVTLGRLRSIELFVTGQARQPGKHLVSSLSSLINALFETGGPSSNGSLRAIELRRAGKKVASVDMYAFLAQGDNSADVQLQSGDIIFIPPAGARVALLGIVNTPAIYELRGNESIKQILAMSGGLPTLAAPQKAQLERLDASRDIARYVEDFALDAKGLALVLKAGDVLKVFQISPQIANVVTLRGSVASPMRYPYQPGMKISDLIPDVNVLIQGDYYTRRNNMVQRETGKQISVDRVINSVKNLLEEINWDYAVIERLDANEVRSSLIPFNLAKAIKEKDPANNLSLLPGDVVTIFSVTDLPVAAEKRSQYASISGEVVAPGVYQILPGETLPQIIKRVGGLTQGAFSFGMVFTRESTRLQQQENLNKSVRRLESDLNSQAISAGQNSSDPDKAAAMQAQLAGQKLLLARMKDLKASGRIALELDPMNPVLPPVHLEDGDQINVPAQPSFVGVFGEVFAESSFIHKPSNTVGDYLTKAGLTRDADTDNLLVIRADGTVEGNSNSFWGTGLTSKKLNPGDSVFVPGVLDRRSAYSVFIQGFKDWTSILYQFGLSAAAIKTLRQ